MDKIYLEGIYEGMFISKSVIKWFFTEKFHYWNNSIGLSKGFFSTEKTRRDFRRDYNIHCKFDVLQNILLYDCYLHFLPHSLGDGIPQFSKIENNISITL